MTRHHGTAIVVACAAMLVWPASRATHSRGVVVRAETAASPAGELWLAPEANEVAAHHTLAEAVRELAAGRSAEAMATFEGATADPVLGNYALLYLGRAQLALGRSADAIATSQRLQRTSPTGYLEEAALWLAADAAVAAPEPAAALRFLRRLTEIPSVLLPATFHLRWGRAALEAGDREGATRAFRTLYLEYPLAPEAADATSELAALGVNPLKATPETLAAILMRGERLFAGKQYGDARAAFESVKTLVKGDDRDRVALRLAACDFYTKRYPATLTALRAFSSHTAARTAEAEFLYLGTLRETGRVAEYFSRLTPFVEHNVDSVLTERALNDLAQFYTLANDDKQAAEAFAGLYARFPQGALADRAAWKAGWWAYKTGEFAEAARLFESAAIGMPHADFRPGWLYWAAKAHLQLGQTAAAVAGFDRTIADYRNTYYGRAAIRESERIRAAMRPTDAGSVSPASLTWPLTIAAGPRPENTNLIQGLLAAGMYDEAIGELRRLQASAGTSPLVEATIAFALNRQGRLRPAITAMRRAYPQFMAAGGEALPKEILTVIFPVDHWDVIQQHALDKQLDRFLVAALIAQESTFQADIRSSANAWGLMQIVPATGRQYAQRLGIRPFSTSRLTDPDTNVQIGTTYFAELLQRFGDAAPALAAYNAGSSRVVKWLADRPGADREAFVDDIPYPETQNYVKRILGTAEDYRRLYR